MWTEMNKKRNASEKLSQLMHNSVHVRQGLVGLASWSSDVECFSVLDYFPYHCKYISFYQ